MYRPNLVQLLNRILKFEAFTILRERVRKEENILLCNCTFFMKKLLISGVLTCNTCPFYVIFHLINAYMQGIWLEQTPAWLAFKLDAL